MVAGRVGGSRVRTSGRSHRTVLYNIDPRAEKEEPSQKRGGETQQEPEAKYQLFCQLGGLTKAPQYNAQLGTVLHEVAGGWLGVKLDQGQELGLKHENLLLVY